MFVVAGCCCLRCPQERSASRAKPKTRTDYGSGSSRARTLLVGLYTIVALAPTNASIIASEEIVIWLNGGPGCSSLDGLFQENGPFLWQSGVYEPVPNPYSWTNLTNVVYVDQPIGTGFSPYAPGATYNVTNETVVGEQFAGFWKNFINLFDMEGYKVYITGERYAVYDTWCMVDTRLPS